MLKKYFSIALCCLVFTTVASADGKHKPKCPNNGTAPSCPNLACSGDTETNKQAYCHNEVRPYCDINGNPSCEKSCGCQGSTLVCNDPNHCENGNQPYCKQTDEPFNIQYELSCEYKPYCANDNLGCAWPQMKADCGDPAGEPKPVCLDTQGRPNDKFKVDCNTDSNKYWCSKKNKT